MKVIKKHLKNLQSVSVYPNGLLYTFEKNDKETGVRFCYYIRVRKEIDWYQSVEEEPTKKYNRLYFSYYHSTFSVEPLNLMAIKQVTIYTDNATKKQKENGISSEYVRVLLDNGVMLVSKNYELPNDISIKCNDSFCYDKTYSENQLDTYTCIHEIK